MRLWVKVLIGALALILVLVAGAALFISQVDPNAYRSKIGDAVEDATGRAFRVGGDLRIKLLPVPSVEANDITFANVPWGSQPDMLRAKRLRADLAILPLLEGRMVIHRFVAIEPHVFLETDAEGRGNWQFGDKDAQSAEIDADAGAPSGELGIAVSQIRVEKAGFDYLDGKTGSKTVLHVDELTIGAEEPGSRVSLSLRATYQDLPVALDGRLGAAGTILNNQPIEVDLKGTFGDAGVSVQGAVGKPLDGRDLRLDVALKSPSTKKITDVAGVEVEEIGPVELALRLVEEGGHVYLDPISVSARPRGTDARISGSIKNIPLDRLSASASAKAQSKPMKVDLEGSFGESRLHVVGDVGNPIEAKDLRLDAALDTKSTRLLTELAGIEFEEIGPVKLTLTLLEQDGHYDIDDIKLTARPRETDASMRGSVKNLVLDLGGAKGSGAPAKVNIKGTLGEARFAVTGKIGKPMEGKDLRLKVALEAKSTRPLTDLAGVDVEELGPLDLKLTVIEKDGRFNLGTIDTTARPRDARVTIKGSIKDVIDHPRPDLDVSVSAKTLRQLDETLPAVGPVSLSAKVRPRGKVVEIRDLAAKIGKSDLSGSATVDTGGKRPSAGAKLRASLIDLVELVPPVQKTDAGVTAEKPSGGKIFPDDPLPLDALEKANGKIELAVDRLITPKLTLKKVNVAVGLDNGNLTVKSAAYIAGGRVGATIDINSRTQPAKFRADIDTKKVSIGALTKEIRGYETSKGLDSNLKIKLHGQGDSVRALMAGLDGDIRLEIGEGSLNNAVLDRVGADLLTRILGVAVPKDEKDKVTMVKCGVVRFAVKEGGAIADETLVLETDKVLLKGGGLIDLKTEDLDVGAHLAARKGIRIGAGTLSSLVRVQGTLAKPRLGTDLKSMAKTGARVGAAVATLGLSLIAESAYDRIGGDDQPCRTALDRPIEVTPSEFRARRTSSEK